LTARGPDQHPVHLGHNRLPQGRDAEPPQHPQQRLLRRRDLPLHRGGPDLHPGALLPLLRHGHGQPRGHQRTARDGDPAPGFDPARRWLRWREERCTSLYGVPTMFIAEWALPRLRVVRPVDGAHRDHGRLALPGRGDEEADRRGHRRDDHLLRHDRDLAGVDADPHRRLVRAQGRHRRRVARTWRSRSSTRTGDPCRAARPASSARKGYSVMLGYWNEPDKTAEADRRRRLDAHRRPGGDGRRRLRADHRPDQGHGHPRRREHLPARDRGVPLHPPRHRRRPGHRGARREVRRGAVRLDPLRPAPSPLDAAASASSPPASSRTTRSRATSRSSTTSR
jgi:hypothetical protein